MSSPISERRAARRKKLWKATKKSIVVLGKGVIALAAQDENEMLEGGLVAPLNVTIRIVDANAAEAKSEYKDCKDFPHWRNSRRLERLEGRVMDRDPLPTECGYFVLTHGNKPTRAIKFDGSDASASAVAAAFNPKRWGVVDYDSNGALALVMLFADASDTRIFRRG